MSFTSVESKAWFPQIATIDTVTGKRPETWTIEVTLWKYVYFSQTITTVIDCVINAMTIE